MAANTSPIFTLVPRIDIASLSGNIGLTRADGVGTIATDIFKIFTPGSNGSWVDRIRIMPASTASLAMTASCIRFYWSTQSSGATTAADTCLFDEMSVAAVTASHTTNANTPMELILGYPVPSNRYMLASIDDNLAANTRWQISIYGGDY